MIVFVFCLSASAAQAGPDLYGIQMKNEDFARDLMVRENNVIPDFSNDRPGMDKRVYAYGYASSIFGRGRGLSLTVYNHSERTIATQRLFRECVVVTRHGRRYDRFRNQMQWQRDRLEPGHHATFNLIFPNVDLRLEDIRMVIFSFDMGRTSIFLFPVKPIEEPTQPPARLEENTPSAKVPQKAPQPTPKVEEVKPPAPKAQEAPPQAPKGPHCVTPVTMVQSVFSGAGRVMGLFGRRAPAPPKTKAEAVAAPRSLSKTMKKSDKAAPALAPPPAAEDTSAYFKPEFKAKVQEGEAQVKKAVTIDRPWSMDKPDKAMVRTPADYPLPKAAPPRAMAEVVQVDRAHGFIVINAGTVDGVREESIVSVLRNGRRIGKAMVRKVRDKVSAAGILPEWQTKTVIQAGDQVELS